MKGIYAIKNNKNGRIYIGQSVDIAHRFQYHKWFLKNGEHDNKRLQKDFDKYGIKAFNFEVLEKMPDASTEELCEAEKRWIEKTGSFENGYNMTTGGLGTPGTTPWNIGKEHSEEARRKISEKAKNRTGNKNAFFGKKHTEKAKEQIRSCRSIPVKDMETGTIYASALEANIAMSGKKGSKVTDCIKGRAKTAYGRKWAYA